ncbi:MAG: hypothetical protein ACK4VW_01810 [Anaerolineales bacterium]
MSRIIHTEGAGKERPRLLKSIVLALRELGKQPSLNAQARDLLAYLVFALETLADGIEESVAAWEKRGYWLKADRFRLEWSWSDEFAAQLKAALLQENWSEASHLVAQITGKLGHIKVSEHHRLGTPWVGAWERLQKEAVSLPKTIRSHPHESTAKTHRSER